MTRHYQVWVPSTTVNASRTIKLKLPAHGMTACARGGTGNIPNRDLDVSRSTPPRANDADFLLGISGDQVSAQDALSVWGA